MSLIIRYSAEEGVLRSTGDKPGMLVISTLPPDHPPGFAIDPHIDPAIVGRDTRDRLRDDLVGLEWVEVFEVIEGLAGDEEASVLWDAVVGMAHDAVVRPLRHFRVKEFGTYMHVVFEVAEALVQRGYEPAPREDAA